MNKYQNIFWHQGIRNLTKISKERAEHLENDVTKSLLNIFQYADKSILNEFLKLINVQKAAESFEFDFQIFDKDKYRLKPTRIMVSLISEFTKREHDKNYNKKYTIPDACIFNPSTSILIESKTQSPLIEEQIDNHIKEYLGEAKRVTITWEQLHERFKQLIPKLKNESRFLVIQFCNYLELIGLSDFNGFNESDFNTLALIQSMSPEDFLDFKRILTKKVERFTKLLYDEVTSYISFHPSNYKIGKVDGKSSNVWSAIYFYMKSEEEHVNNLPNINFNFFDSYIDFSLNAEIASSRRIIEKKLKYFPNEFSKVTFNLDETKIVLFYKFQYRPKQFIWRILPGYPYLVNKVSAESILNSINQIYAQWEDIKRTILFELESRMTKHESGKAFSEKEILFAQNNNKTPNIVFRIGKIYPIEQVVRNKKKIINVLKNDIIKHKELIKYLVT